jgi:hypothetical protein
MNCFCIGNVVDLVYEVVDHDWWVGSPSIVNRRSQRLAELTEVELRRCSGVQKLAARQWRGRRGRWGSPPLRRWLLGHRDLVARRRWTVMATHGHRGRCRDIEERELGCEGFRRCASTLLYRSVPR